MPEAQRHVPRATYRLQFHAGFTLDDAAAIADYLAALGVSHIYASPYLQAAPGSTHGYDVLDHSRVNEELGGAAAHQRFCKTLGQSGLGQVLDIVPNHMSISHHTNTWWWDVLENGPASRYANYFDVDWHPPERKLHNMVLLPILGDHYGKIIDERQVQLYREGGSFTFRYFDYIMPAAPRSLNDLLSAAAARSESDTLAFLAEAFGRLPLASLTDLVSIVRRHRDKEVLRALLERLCAEDKEVVRAIDKEIERVNASPSHLDELLERQNYRLAYWRTARQELDYRRFFDINTLVSLRMEDEQVFRDTHRLVLGWLERTVIDGVRIDHPDGLRDPEQYFARLRQAATQAWIVVEKILEPGETLPSTWPVEGTTGYDFLNRLQGVFIDPQGEIPLTDFYGEFTGQSTDFPEIVREKKQQVLKDLFGSEINRLANMLAEICERHRYYRDFTRTELNATLREVISCFPVYRSYIQPDVNRVTNEDIRYVTEAVEEAKRRRPDWDPAPFDALRDLLLLQVRGEQEHEFVMRFQQTTGPVMAKGLEDTAFYAFHRLIALNEVGGDPGRFGMTLDDFHQACQETQRHWPESMLASTTHDTKRGEDVRIRIGLLSEAADQWRAAVTRWSEINARHRVDGMPDRNAEYLLYQTLFGAWPIDEQRATEYMLKAVREAKVYTSWTQCNPEYEAAVQQFTKAILTDAEFRADLEQLVSELLRPARVASLGQTLIKLTTPGVPDIYQGTELWTLSLVDPDNRRPVDYEIRRQLLADLNETTPEMILARMEDGLPKMWVVRQALRLRAREPEAFGREGSYESLRAQGERADHVLAFVRGGRVITIVPRWLVRLGEDWKNTRLRLPNGLWQNEFTGDTIGGTVQISELLRRFPVALMSRAESHSF
jgi:(1->4)-alpha-D-glucan 1-alpha-D-glucosylmutase